MILGVQIQNLRYALMHVQKIPGGLNINIFVKTGMKLPFALKNQRQKNLKFEFLELFSPEKRVFWFLKKPTCVSALIQLTVALLS